MLRGVPAGGQPAIIDSVSVSSDGVYLFRPTQLIAPIVFSSAGIAIHCASRDAYDKVVRETADWKVQQFFYEDVREGGARPECHFENYIQYVPIAMDLGLGLLGVKARNPFVDRSIEAVLASLSCVALDWTVKLICKTERPNGGGYSFPSGHTATSFLGAELVRIEYGYAWGAGAYAVGLTVGTMRMYNNSHWLSDVLLGAGIGILAANIGAWCLYPVKDLFNIPDISWDGLGTKAALTFYPSIDPFPGVYAATVALAF